VTYHAERAGGLDLPAVSVHHDQDLLGSLLHERDGSREVWVTVPHPTERRPDRVEEIVGFGLEPRVDHGSVVLNVLQERRDGACQQSGLPAATSGHNQHLVRDVLPVALAHDALETAVDVATQDVGDVGVDEHLEHVRLVRLPLGHGRRKVRSDLVQPSDTWVLDRLQTAPAGGQREGLALHFLLPESEALLQLRLIRDERSRLKQVDEPLFGPCRGFGLLLAHHFIEQRSG